MDILKALQADGGISAVARELNVDDSTAQSGMAALLPAVLSGMQNQAGVHPSGFGGLAGILAGLGGGDLLNQVTNPAPTDPSPGNDVLGQIFGTKETSRAVASDAAGKTGLSPDLLKKMLPLLAMLVAGYLAKQSGGNNETGGGLEGILGSVLGGGASAGSGGPGGILGGLLGGGSGGGNVLNDILGKLGR
ncbi:DUF937 domain-containing protein [Sphingomonas aliaeris]|uniref:DUF937 domain-containing protein n=1 Tax=Sphingomonas aliaeris TaxID=2759526 RepID=A0A974NUT5_9SPHN|nr:DUF937 domain-containing protein [Sphingomonas aliaeris]QQV77371.1 DUF937 domain-containing protein [Sphingomonas aliaeris]